MKLIADDRKKTCAVLLAAGLGSRFSAPTGHKLLADLRGRAVYRWALDAVVGAGFGSVVVVTGAVALDLATMPDAMRIVREVHNPDFAAGQATSLQCGLRAASEIGAEAMIVGLADQPFITTDAWRTVAASPAEIAVATYAGQRANPVMFRRSVWSLLPSKGDQGARSLIALRPEIVSEVACNGSSADIDTMEDLQQWNSSTNSL